MPARAAVVATIAALSFALGAAGDITLSETGSTLILPLFKEWVAAYAKTHPDIRISVGATGSEAGIDQVIAHKVQMGTSDAYMTDRQAMDNRDILNIPLAISAQTVDTNVPELHGSRLKLSGPVLAGIYSGTIRNWDATQIADLNRGLHLPHHAIIPVHRSDGSGDTFIFTQFLSFSTPDWDNGPRYGTSINWPSVPGALTASGNQGMLQTIARTPYAVGYLGASWEAEAGKAGIQMAILQNQDGKFVLPTPATIAAAANVLTPRTPADERLTLVFAPGPNSYPLINYEYAVICTKQSDAQTAAAIRNFLLWCISPQGGSTAEFLDAVHFIALPTSIRALSELQIAKIQKS